MAFSCPMTTNPITMTIPPPSWTSPTGAGAPGPAEPTAEAGRFEAWLDRCEHELAHPAVVEDRLRRNGWHPLHAAAAARAYRRRYNEHSIGYFALLAATGVAALAAGSAGHVLARGLGHPVNRNALAVWLTLLVCALPFAAWAHWWARRVDEDDAVAVWSRSRRTLATVLLWSCTLVGIVRLLTYVAQLIGALVGASWASTDSAASGAVNVSIVVAIALPLGLWAYDFGHRFDGEDPTVPPERRQRRSR